MKMFNELLANLNPNMAIIFVPLIGSGIFNQYTNEKIKRTFLQPPGYVFGIVWTILYILLGVFIWLLIDNKKMEPYFWYILVTYVINLSINYIWTTVVFKWQLEKIGVYMLTILLGTTIFMTVLTENKLLASLLVPYMTWLIFAVILNIELLRLTTQKNENKKESNLKKTVKFNI
jgi:tryptophan-rich sensory protein